MAAATNETNCPGMMRMRQLCWLMTISRVASSGMSAVKHGLGQQERRLGPAEASTWIE